MTRFSSAETCFFRSSTTSGSEREKRQKVSGEPNARRAKLLKRAEAWRWSSPWARRNGGPALQRWLRPCPVDRPRNWLANVNRLVDHEALQRVPQSVIRGAPLGDERWKGRVAIRLGLHITLGPRGRPRKDTKESS